MQTKIEFHGKGGELFVKMLRGGFLTAITLGVYAPWFVAEMNRYLYSKVTLRGSEWSMHPRFAGTGMEILKMNLLGFFLCGITLGIYTPWFIARQTRYFAEHTEVVSESGMSYRLHSNLKGGELFMALFVGQMLVGVTLGIYLPWFMCKIARVFAQNLKVLDAADQAVGEFSFEGKGGQFLGVVLLNGLLCSITLGIYTPWALVKAAQLFAGSSRLSTRDESFMFAFEGKGGQLFGKLLLNGLLTSITLGVYAAWALVDVLGYMFGNLVAKSDGARAVHQVGGRPAPQLPDVAAIAATARQQQSRVS